MKRILCAALATAALTVMTSSVSAAPLDRAWRVQLQKWCSASDYQNVPLAKRVRGCTKLIEDGGSPLMLETYHVLRGQAYADLGDDGRAQEDFDWAIERAPDNGPFRLVRAEFYRARGMTPAAQADFGKAIALVTKELAKEKRPMVRSYLLFFRSQGRVEWGQDLKAALADCNAALALNPTDADGLETHAFIEYRLGNYAKAIAGADAALEKNSRMPSSFYVRGLARQKSGDAAGSAADIAKAKEIDPGIAKTFAGYGVTP